MNIYYPYPAQDNKHKYYIITASGKKIYFGAKGYSDYTIHKDPERKGRYLKRHEGDGKTVDTNGFWATNLLWN